MKEEECFDAVVSLMRWAEEWQKSFTPAIKGMVLYIIEGLIETFETKE